jgi:gluconolactonase
MNRIHTSLLALSVWMSFVALVGAQTTRPATRPAAAQAPVAMPDIPGVVAAGTPVILLKGGMTSSEGPVAAPDGSVYFSEPSVNKIYKVDPQDNITLLFDAKKVDDPAGERWRLPALAVNSKGLVFACRRAGPKIGVAIVYPLDQARFIAETYQGTSFAAPNDLSMASDGGIFFTDPGEGARRPHAIYYVNPSGAVTLATDNLGGPNGLVLSRDEKTLYAVDSQSEYVFTFDVQPDGTLTNRKNFARLKGVLKTGNTMNNGIDGMTIDDDGRVYTISNAGIEVFTSRGEAVGVIPLPIKAQNLAFAGTDGKTLFVVGHGFGSRDGNLYKIRMLSQKFAGRAK